MKTKNLNKIFIISLSLLLMLTAMFTFSACKEREFEPKDISIEQAETLLSNGLLMAKNATSIYVASQSYYNADKQAIQHANGNCLYMTEDGEYFQWYILENDIWTKYEYDESTSQGEKGVRPNIQETSGVSLLYKNLFSDFESCDIISGKQTSENTYVLKIELYDMPYDITITDAYLTLISHEMEGVTYNGTIEYNSNKVIPELPNIQWE